MTVLLSSLTTLGLGGPAGQLVVTHSTEDFVRCLHAADNSGERVLIVGGGSNLVVSDDGFPGTVIQVVGSGYSWSGDLVTVEAGTPWDEFVADMVDQGFAGVEALSGIPGSSGATPVQNVGAYGQEIADTLHSVLVMDRQTGWVESMDAAECGLAYRHSIFKRQARYAVLEVTLRLSRQQGLSAPIRYAELARTLGVEIGERAPLAAVRAAVLRLRGAKGMLIDPADPDSRSAGSFFTNPVLSPEDFTRASALAGAELPSYEAVGGRKVPAAWLIEASGFTKGYGAGRVRISSRHTLALVHLGGGNTSELIALAREIRDGVHRRFGVMLSPEPVFVGTSL